MDDIPSIASYVLERPAFGAFTLAFCGLIAVGWYAVQRHDESKPIKVPTRVLLGILASSTVVFAGVAFWPRGLMENEVAPAQQALARPEPISAPVTPTQSVARQQFEPPPPAEAPRKSESRREAQPASDLRVGPNAWGLKCFNRPFASITDEQSDIYRQCRADADPRILDDMFYNTEADALAAVTVINACIRELSPTFRCEAEYRRPGGEE
ncbi:MAG: hypothetical protein U1C74_07210 [Phenylobacterium sp.]|nr:hypothetical protein [Phenylobacterium sp.]